LLPVRRPCPPSHFPGLPPCLSPLVICHRLLLSMVIFNCSPTMYRLRREMNQTRLVNKILHSPSSLLNYTELFFKFFLDIDRYPGEKRAKPFQFDKHHSACLTDSYRVSTTSLQVNLLKRVCTCMQG